MAFIDDVNVKSNRRNWIRNHPLAGNITQHVVILRPCESNGRDLRGKLSDFTRHEKCVGQCRVQPKRQHEFAAFHLTYDVGSDVATRIIAIRSEEPSPKRGGARGGPVPVKFLRDRNSDVRCGGNAGAAAETWPAGLGALSPDRRQTNAVTPRLRLPVRGQRRQRSSRLTSGRRWRTAFDLDVVVPRWQLKIMTVRMAVVAFDVRPEVYVICTCFMVLLFLHVFASCILMNHQLIIFYYTLIVYYNC